MQKKKKTFSNDAMQISEDKSIYSRKNKSLDFILKLVIEKFRNQPNSNNIF